MAAAVFKSIQIYRNEPPVTPLHSCDLVAAKFEFDLDATKNGSGALEAGDLIEFGYIPAGCVLVDSILEADDLDTGGPTVTLDVGVMTGTPGDTVIGNRAIGAEIFSASTVAQAGGLVRPTLKTSTRIAVDMTADKLIGVKCNAAPTTPATTGKIGLTLFYRAARNGS